MSTLKFRSIEELQSTYPRKNGCRFRTSQTLHLRHRVCILSFRKRWMSLMKPSTSFTTKVKWSGRVGHKATNTAIYRAISQRRKHPRIDSLHYVYRSRCSNRRLQIPFQIPVHHQQSKVSRIPQSTNHGASASVRFMGVSQELLS